MQGVKRQERRAPAPINYPCFNYFEIEDMFMKYLWYNDNGQ